jgi:hypothetical protein
MHLSKFVHSETGRILMSIILGIGLATLFRSVCSGKNCKKVMAPPLSEIDDQTYKFNGKCYKMQKNVVKCDKSKRIIHINNTNLV